MQAAKHYVEYEPNPRCVFSVCVEQKVWKNMQQSVKCGLSSGGGGQVPVGFIGAFHFLGFFHFLLCLNFL